MGRATQIGEMSVYQKAVDRRWSLVDRRSSIVNRGSRNCSGERATANATD
jgi:hypothetical protein